MASQRPWRTGPGGPSFSGWHQNPRLLLHQPTRHTDAADLPEGGKTLWRRVAQAGSECERRAGEATGGLWGGQRGASGWAAAGDPARLYLHRQEGCRWPLCLGEYQGIIFNRNYQAEWKCYHHLLTTMLFTVYSKGEVTNWKCFSVTFITCWKLFAENHSLQLVLMCLVSLITLCAMIRVNMSSK